MVGAVPLSWLWPGLVVAGLLTMAYAVVELVRGARARGGSAGRVLRRRYARGEIDDQEYLRRRARR